MSDMILTYQKKYINPLQPKATEICIEDIAHALSMMTRANGHFPDFYSVGQHSLHCYKEAKARAYSKRVRLACLLHDGSEAYLSDITRPVKRRLTEYQKIESVLQETIYIKFLGELLTEDEQDQVKSVDDTLLYYEFKHYMDEALQKQKPVITTRPIFETRDMKQVEKEFIEIWQKEAIEYGQ